MSHIIQLSDEHYQIVVAFAAEQKKMPEEIIALLIDEKKRAEEYALVDAAFANDPDWIAGAREAQAQAERGEGRVFATTAEFLRHLGADDQELAAMRQIEQGNTDADS